jgi:hypothetical protein
MARRPVLPLDGPALILAQRRGAGTGYPAVGTVEEQALTVPRRLWALEVAWAETAWPVPLGSAWRNEMRVGIHFWHSA